MGQWTPDHYDNVLLSKIKGLVTGAIKRSKLEKTDPTISYECFVKELDVGDSFTTSIIDILVKESADRRLRQGTSTDRRLIADRTAKNLRMLATPLRVYHERPGRRMMARRNVNLTDYLSAPPEEMEMDEEDDDFESMLESAASPFEGARMNSDLYDAYGSHTSWSHPLGSLFTRSAHPTYPAAVTSAASAGSREANSVDPAVLPALHSPPAPNRSGPWSLPPSASYAGSVGLTRQPSMRRTIRASRAVDFNDFTRQRRSTIRQSATQEAGGSRSESSEDVSAGRPLPTPARSPVPEEPSSAPAARRFFPFSRTRRHEIWGGSSTWSEPPESRGAEEPPSAQSEPASSRPWYLIPAPALASQPPPENEPGEERTYAGAPRLRRGGLRAPESMLSRHASPSVGATALRDVPTVTVHTQLLPEEHPLPSDTSRTEGEDEVVANQLLTPRSENHTDEHEYGAGP